MTKQKTFKRRVRERMEKTGESYASARAALIGAEPAGLYPDTSALRFALADRGLEISEALTLIIAGGAGAAAMAFRYEAEDFTHFHLSGWNPFQSDVRDAVTRLGLTPDIHETGGAKAAEKALRERLEDGVQLAWVEDYRVIAVLALDGDTARIYDRTVQTIPAERTRRDARGRVRKQRHRLLAIGAGRAGRPRGRAQGPRSLRARAGQGPQPRHVARRHRALGGPPRRHRQGLVGRDVPARQAPRRRAARHGGGDPLKRRRPAAHAAGARPARGRRPARPRAAA